MLLADVAPVPGLDLFANEETRLIALGVVAAALALCLAAMAFLLFRIFRKRPIPPADQRAELAIDVAALPLAYLDSPAVRAQAFMRSPSISVGARLPSITPTMTPSVTSRIDPNIAGRGIVGIGRTSPNLRTDQACSYAYRDRDGNCSGQPVASGSRR